MQWRRPAKKAREQVLFFYVPCGEEIGKTRCAMVSRDIGAIANSAKFSSC